HQIALKIRIIENPPHIALEVTVIDRIKTHQRAKEPPVSLHDALSDAIAKEIPSRRQPDFQFIQRGEERPAIELIACLQRCKPRFLKAIVDSVVNKRREA